MTTKPRRIRKKAAAKKEKDDTKRECERERKGGD